MAVPQKLLEKLVCPGTHEKLEYDKENNRLICRERGLAFKIVDDIPVLLLDEAEKI
jgi:uncharacterized protein YbaR (Trm112 family)